MTDKELREHTINELEKIIEQHENCNSCLTIKEIASLRCAIAYLIIEGKGEKE